MKNATVNSLVGILCPRNKSRFFSILFFLLPITLCAQQFYVSPSGLSTGNGSIANPWNLQTALNQPAAVVPGSTILLTEGTYKGTFTSKLTGTAAKPIILKPMPGARVIVDGSLAGQTVKNITVINVYGAYTWYMGFEITNSDPVRTISQSGSNPQERRGEAIAVMGPGVKLINLVIYDTGQGISAWTPAENSEYYGNVIFNNGWWAPDREHGHGIYSQNNTGTQKFINNIILNNFSYGWQAYGSNTSYLKNFYVEGNTVFNDRWLFGGSAPMDNIFLKGNMTFRDTMEFGYSTNVLNTNLTLENNIFSSQVAIKYWKNVTATGNLFYTGASYGYPITFMFNGAPDVSTFNFDYNTYYWSNPPSPYQSELAFNWGNISLSDNDPNKWGSYFFTPWKQMGKDAHSTIQTFPLAKDNVSYTMIGKKIVVQKNIYDSARANVVVYNWDKSNTVDVDVTGVLQPGDSYKLHNVQDYFGDVITGTYTSGSLSVPMTNHTVAKPLGYNNAFGRNSFPEFGTFVLEKTASAPQPPFSFLSFLAERQNNDVVLKWSSQNDQSTKSYAVERSTDGTNFTGIGAIAASRSSNNYSFTDIAPSAGTYSYRIKRLANDNSVTYSAVQQLTVPESGTAFNFIDFRVQLVNKDARVNWTTGLEYESKTFTVERSKDGSPFTILLTANASSNPQTQNVYGYMDVAPAAGTYTYRIRRTANDNSITYSATQQLTVPATAQSVAQSLDYDIIQNPVTSTLQLKFYPSASTTTLRIEIRDGSNQLRYSEQKTISGVVVSSIPVSNLNTGNYFLSVITSTSAITKQFIKL